MPRPRPGALVLHATAAYLMYWGFSTLDNAPAGKWIRTQKGQHFQFLTIQGLGVAWLTMVISLAADIFQSKIVLTVKRCFLVVSMPLEVTISSIYWTLIILFPHLILMDEPPTSEQTSSSASATLMRVPFKVDLALHAVPGIALVLDFFFFEERYTKYQVARVVPLTTILFGLWYVSWVEYCASHNGRFPYPFLESPYHIRALVYVGAVVQSFLSFRFLNSRMK
ncbi:hypothetical protein BDM02DRAFT_3104938 [Thelephora ganbajun]|uniref:Uncharacterized protein n=1 Tax=Thelephora ganbajun TaxID=370292 RepID=A0ACB6Z0L8_THEGA|nr:hypothetical protein BDM02DRAFT_3104938 [Thelephora ganbajun]